MGRRLRQLGTGIYLAGLMAAVGTQAVMIGDITHRLLRERALLNPEEQQRCIEYSMASLLSAAGGIGIQYRYRENTPE